MAERPVSAFDMPPDPHRFAASQAVKLGRHVAPGDVHVLAPAPSRRAAVPVPHQPVSQYSSPAAWMECAGSSGSSPEVMPQDYYGDSPAGGSHGGTSVGSGLGHAGDWQAEGLDPEGTGFGAFTSHTLGAGMMGEPPGVLRSLGTGSGLARQGSATLGQYAGAHAGTSTADGLLRSSNYAHGRRSWDVSRVERLVSPEDLWEVPGIRRTAAGPSRLSRDPLAVQGGGPEGPQLDEPH